MSKKLRYRLMTVEESTDAVLEDVPADPELHTYWIAQAIRGLRSKGIYLVMGEM